jgi:hypothetical protein
VKQEYVEQLTKTEQELVLYKVKDLSVPALAKKLSKGLKGGPSLSNKF